MGVHFLTSSWWVHPNTKTKIEESEKSK